MKADSLILTVPFAGGAFTLSVSGTLTLDCLQQWTKFKLGLLDRHGAAALPEMRDWFRTRGYQSELRPAEDLNFRERWFSRFLLFLLEITWRGLGTRMYERTDG